MEKVHIHSYLKRGQALLKKAEKVLKDAPFDKVSELAQRDIVKCCGSALIVSR